MLVIPSGTKLLFCIFMILIRRKKSLFLSGVKLIPVNSWTLAEKGARQVPIVGLEDKREMTMLLACTASGKMLPPQLIYAGTTEKCHPKFTFPEDWEIYHSKSRWSDEDTMLRYVDNIIIPYFTKMRAKFGQSKKGLCIFDVYAPHKLDSVLQKLEDNNILRVFVPAGTTGELQPLDVSVNHLLKYSLKQSFSNWYSKEVQMKLETGTCLEKVQVNFNLSVIKPLHAQWLVDAFTSLSNRVTEIIDGFIKSGIKDNPYSADTEDYISETEQASRSQVLVTKKTDDQIIADCMSYMLNAIAGC